MRQSMLEKEHDYNQRIVTAAMEIEKRDLRTSALGAMATLCVSDSFVNMDSYLTTPLSGRPGESQD